MFVILEAFNGKLRSGPMELEDADEVRLPFSIRDRSLDPFRRSGYSEGRFALFEPDGNFVDIPNCDGLGKHARIYVLTDI